MTSLILLSSLCFSEHFWIFVLGCTLFPPIYTEIDNWDFESCSRLEYFGVESTAYLPTNSQKNLPIGKVRWTNCAAIKCFFRKWSYKNRTVLGRVVLVNSSVFMRCCSCEITKNILFQLLKNFKVESILSAAIFLLFAYIRKSSKRISTSSSEGAKFLIKELLCTHIASHLLPNSQLVATLETCKLFSHFYSG